MEEESSFAAVLLHNWVLSLSRGLFCLALIRSLSVIWSGEIRGEVVRGVYVVNFADSR